MSSSSIELETSQSQPEISRQNDQQEVSPDADVSQLVANQTAPPNAVTAIPDGGYGWIVVCSCAMITFWFSGFTGSWGVIQTALLSTTLKGTPASTTSFIGSVGITICVAFGLFAVRLMSLIGSRRCALLGISLLGLGALTSGFTTGHVAGLFQTFGLVLGVGDCLCYTATNVMPTQYFSRRLGLASGLIKLGGGLGATILSITLNSLIERVGVAWMFRILGMMTLATGIPAALAIKDRTPLPNAPIMDLSLFKSVPFTAIFFAGAAVTFTLFVPPFFLPLFAQSIGLSSGTGAGLVAGFSACTTVGRFAAGPLSDRIGPLNTFVITVVLNAVTTLAIWPVSSTLPTLAIFAMLNGISNGAFFTTLPIVVVSMVDSSRAAVAMSMSITGWTGGYLMGTPIAGYLLEAGGGGQDGLGGVDVYRPAIFYAGGVATLGSICVIIARLVTEKKVLKRV